MSHQLPLSTLDRDEQLELRQTVREAATAAGYPGAVRALEGSDDGIDVALWKLLAEDIGLAGVGLPEEVGGLGGLAEVLAVAEELGATLAPVPFLTSTVLCGQVLAACGPAAAPWLERIAAGEIAAPAFTDRRGVWAADGVDCTSDGTTVTGSVRFVPFGVSAAFLVVAARTESGIDVFVVEAADATPTALPVLDFSRPVASLALEAAPATRLTEAGTGASAIDAGVEVALLAVAADQLGGTQYCFDMTLEYVKVRRQFNREIGSFQAIKHRMADALMLVEMARSGLEKVTWSETESLPAEASLLKAWGSDSYLDVAAEAVQLHGGIGFTWEHDAHLYFRRARFDAAFLGDAPYHRERLATLLAW
jgi:alkylation response protein AidB-like acyl-CoA dehydrogenase